MQLSGLTDYHFELWMKTNYSKRKAPEKYIGYAIIDDGHLHGIGMIFYEGGVWNAAFDSVQPPSPLAHRGALTLRKIAKQSGIKEIYSLPDIRVPNAEKWLSRIGFVEEEVGKPWRLNLGVDIQCSRSRGVECGVNAGGEASTSCC